MDLIKKSFALALATILFVSTSMTASASGLKDVRNHWAKESIEKVVKLGLMKGYSDNTFGTKKNVTREELAAIAVRLVGDPQVDQGKTFDDIKGRWSETVIKKSVALDLILPISANQFAPAQMTTRQEVARAMYKVLDKHDLQFGDSPSSLTDIAGSPYKNEIDKVVSSGIMSGYPDKTFAPTKNITRAELASILVRVYESTNGMPIVASAEKKVSETTVKVAPKMNTAPTIITMNVQTASGTVQVKGKFDREMAEKTLSLINAERRKAGLREVSWSTVLETGTDVRAAEIVHLFSHDRPCQKDWCSVYVLNENNYSIAENIAAGQTSAEAVVEAWMQSPGHRKNILNPAFTKMSVSLFVENSPSEYGMYWAQHFKN